MKTLPCLAVAASLTLTSYQVLSTTPQAQRPSFESFPVKEQFAGHVAVPRLVTKQDREFRTELQQAARQRPNFAGHYILTNIGCGASCVMTAALDAKTGRVTWLPFTLCCWGEHVREPVAFRVDSDLVVLEGSKDEGDTGTWLFRLKGGEFVPIVAGAPAGR